MNKMANRILWDRYEAAFLLDYCIKIENGFDRSKAISIVSKRLRDRALLCGKAIDDTFRNENGISMQMSAMRNCYLGREHGLSIARVFRDIVDLYKNKREEFNLILLQESTNNGDIRTRRGETMLVVDFVESKSYAHTKPVSCLFRGNPIQCNGWNALFINAVKAFYKEYADVFPIGKSLTTGARIDIGSSEGMIYPKEIENGVYLECNISATGVITRLKALLDMFKIPYSDMVIEYRTKIPEGNSEEQEKDDKPAWIPQYSEQIKKLISTYFRYGYRLGSPIDLLKLRNYSDSSGIALPTDDAILEKEIKSAGSLIDGKVLIFRDEVLDSIGNLVDSIFESGITVIFYDSLYETNQDFMDENHIANVDLLKEILRHSRPGFYCGQNIVTQNTKITEHNAVVKEIHRVSEERAIIYYSKLVEQLPYIPAEKIAWSLSYADDIVWISEGKYFRTMYFIIHDDDAKAILSHVTEECENKGYASITDVPMSSIAEENYELSESALYASIYSVVLKDHFHLNSKILTKGESNIDVEVLLKAFCNSHTRLTLDETMARAEELTGSQCRRHCLNALYSTKIRIDADHFVDDSQVHFDIDYVDRLLTSIVGEQYTTIRAVSTFALFPTCGQSWNHFLLESYCYRYSKKYRLSVFHFNDKNAGLIVNNNCSMTYIEILCEAVANSSIPLTDEAVGNYLFDNGYAARRKGGNLPQIIERANQIREER